MIIAIELYICFMCKRGKQFFVKLIILIGLISTSPVVTLAQENEPKKVKKSSAKNEKLRKPKKVKNSARANKKRRKQAYKIQDKETKKRMKRAYRNAMRRQKGKKPRNNRLV